MWAYGKRIRKDFEGDILVEMWTTYIGKVDIASFGRSSQHAGEKGREGHIRATWKW